MRDAYLQFVEQVLRIASRALDSLLSGGVEIAPEQYKEALVAAGRWALGRADDITLPEFEEVRERAIAAVLEEEAALYRERVKAAKGE